jgi:hypothetical protein
LAIVALIVGLLVHYFWTPVVTKVTWDPERVPTYQEYSSFSIEIDPRWVVLNEVDAAIEHSDAVDVINKTRTETTDGRLKLTFEVRLNQPGSEQSITVVFGKGLSESHTIDFDVDMPPTAGQRATTFVEMVDGPDESILGTHITLWTNGGGVLISGHAASDVCRAISSAAFEYAVQIGSFNDDFFLGAGFAAIPRDRELIDRTRENYEEIWSDLQKPPLDILSMDLLADAIDKGETRPTDEQQVKLFREVMSGNELVDESDAVERWVRDPDLVRALADYDSQFSINSVVSQIARFDAPRRHQIAEVLREYARVVTTETTFANQSQDVATRTGLVSIRDSAEDGSTQARASLVAWMKSGYPNGKLELDEARLASGVSGIARFLLDASGPQPALLALPFMHDGSSEPVSFDVPKKLFALSDGRGDGNTSVVRQLFRDSIARSLVQNLEDSAARFSLAFEENWLGLQHAVAEVESASDFSAWQTRLVEIHVKELNDRGQVVRVVTKTMSNLAFWVENVRSGIAFKRQSEYFARAAAKVWETINDPKGQAINDAVLLDSFLRGWELAFLDNSKHAPYQKWIRQARPRVWGEIARQAREKGIDIAPLVNEQVVFYVRDDRDTYRIRPMFVGSTDDVVAIKDPHNAMIHYHSRWSSRKLAYLTQQARSESDWARAREAFQSDPDAALLDLAREDIDVALAADDVSIGTDAALRALAISPKGSAQAFTARLWDLWPEPPTAGEEIQVFDEFIVKGDWPQEEGEGREVRRRFVQHLGLRVLEAGKPIMQCLSKAIFGLDDEASAGDQVKDAWIRCFRLSDIDNAALTMAGLLDGVRAAADELYKRSQNWNFDTLGRVMAQSDLQDALGNVAHPVLGLLNVDADITDNKALVEAHIQLEWYQGNYSQALDLMFETLERRGVLGRGAQTLNVFKPIKQALLQALVYSGGEPILRSIQTPSGPALEQGPNRGIGQKAPALTFGIRRGEIALSPMSIDEIAIQALPTEASTTVRFDEKNQPAFRVPSTARVLDDSHIGEVAEHVNMVREVIGEQQAGFDTIRTAEGFLLRAWSRRGESLEAIPVLVAKGPDAIAKSIRFAVEDPSKALGVLDYINTSHGSLLEISTLSKGFDGTAVVIHERDIELVSGNLHRRFKLPDSQDMEQFVRELVEKLKFTDTSNSVDAGLVAEMTAFAEGDTSVEQYFSANRPFPNVEAVSRANRDVRFLTRVNNELEGFELRDGRLHRFGKGSEAVSSFLKFDSKPFRNASNEEVAFLHFDAAAKSDDSVNMQVGNHDVSLPISELRSLLQGGSEPTPTLDNVFANVAPHYILFRDSLVRSASGRGGGKPPGNGDPPPLPIPGEPRSDPDRDGKAQELTDDLLHVAPLTAYLALTKRYPAAKIALDDEPAAALANIAASITISSPEDVGVYIPERDWRITDFGAIRSIRKAMISVGSTVADNMERLDQSSIMVITGHKDSALRRYIDAHIVRGNLKGKHVILFSCYAEGDASLAHRIIKEGGAVGVSFFGEVIHSTAIVAVVDELTRELESLSTSKPPFEAVDLLLRRSIDGALGKAKDQESLKKIMALKSAVLQVSQADVPPPTTPGSWT